MNIVSPALSPDGFKSHSLPFGQQRIEAGALHLWHLDLSGMPATGFLEGEHSDHAARVRARRRRREFYLRLLLAAYLDVPAHEVRIGRETGGKPFISSPESADPLHFNLSHAGDATLVALSLDGPLGVDLEPADRRPRDLMAVARRYFHRGEVDYLQKLQESERQRAWLRIWTLKEALLKAEGGGLAFGLDRFAVQLPAARVESGQVGDVLAQWVGELQPRGAWLAAVAALQAPTVLRGWRLVH